MIFHNFEQRSPEWYKIREKKLTATKAKSILGKEGLAKTNAAIELCAMSLASEAVRGMIEDDYVDFNMQRGIDLEPAAFNCMSGILGLEFIKVNKVGFVEVNEHVGFSPDGIIEGAIAPVEIKCPKIDVFDRLVYTETIQDDYYKQIQFGIRCLDSDYGLFFAYSLHMGKEYSYMQRVNRDEKMIKLIKERELIVTEKKLNYIEKLKKAYYNGYTGYIATPKDGIVLVEAL